MDPNPKSCLLCLRNEGLFANDPTNEIEILFNLFSLPKAISKSLKGNRCCSVCRVKLHFVKVINEEISILNEKLKSFQNEVKEQFVNSFAYKFKQTETEDELITQSRLNLLKELTGTSRLKEEDENLNSTVDFECHEEEGFGVEDEDVEMILSDPLEPTHNSDTDFDQDDNDDDVDSDNDNESPRKKIKMEVKKDGSQWPNRRANQKRKSSAPSVSENESSMKKSFTWKPNKMRKMRKYVCPMCDGEVDFELTKDYEAHLAKFHPSRFFTKCTICHRIILENWENWEKLMRMRNHMRIHEDKRKYACPHCDAAFKLSIQLKSHLRTHIVCDICGGDFTGLNVFNLHLREKHHKNYFNCVYCGMKSRSEAHGYEHHVISCKKKSVRRRKSK